MRFDSSEIGETMSEIVAYGTAVVIEPVVSRLQPGPEPWSLLLWQQRDKRAFIGRLRRAFNARPAYSTP